MPRPPDEKQAGITSEEVLSGGNVGHTTRRGDRVYRTAGPWTPAIQRLLTHVHDRGVDWVPEPFGIEDGREVVGYLPGDVPGYPMPAWVWAEANLLDAGRMLRQLHDATVGYTDPDAEWRQPAREPAEVICHNDVAPYNMVFRDGRLAGLIDVDMASPGPRIWDLAYLAYRMVPLTAATNPDDGPFDEAGRLDRLDALLAAYGMPFRIMEVLRTVQEWLRHLARFSDDLAHEMGRNELHDHARLYRADVAYVQGLIAQPGTR